MGKMPDLGFETSYKDGLCPKLEKNPCKAKIWPSNSGGLGHGLAHFGPAWAGFLPAHQGPNLALKIGPAWPGHKI